MKSVYVHIYRVARSTIVALKRKSLYPVTTPPSALLPLWASSITSGVELGKQRQSGLRRPGLGSAPKAQNPRTSPKRIPTPSSVTRFSKTWTVHQEQGQPHSSLASNYGLWKSLFPLPVLFNPSIVFPFLFGDTLVCFPLQLTGEAWMVRVLMVPPSKGTGPLESPLCQASSPWPAGPRGGATSAEGDRLSLDVPAFRVLRKDSRAM